MPRILSTKILKPSQKELLLNTGISLVEYNSIKITFLDFDLEEESLKNSIFTSRNAVKAILSRNIQLQDCFCVGAKTSGMLSSAGGRVLEQANTATQLAKKLTREYRNRRFHFFSGNLRRDELPELLKQEGIALSETEVYQTTLNPREFDSRFDGIMFFSPSAVKSFTEMNKIDTTAFCIGPSTAEEARKHTRDVVVSNTPAIENVIAKVVSALKIKLNTEKDE